MPEGRQALYEQFNILRIVRGETREQAFTNLIEGEVARNAVILNRRWLTWDDFEYEMLSAGHSINRVTMWQKSKSAPFKDLIKSDGVNVLWDIDGFLDYYKSLEG